MSQELRYLAMRRVRKDERGQCVTRAFAFGAVALLFLLWHYQPSGYEAGHPSAQSSAVSATSEASAPSADTEKPAAAAAPAIAVAARCGDGKCDATESMASCLADCPGVTTPAMCGEEPHSDPGGYAVVWGASHKTQTASECCAACAAHADNPKNKKRPCNSWVFCHSYPQCWSLDTGNWHGFGECWLKWQADPGHPLYGQRGKFSDEFRKKHWNAHKTGKNPDGTRRNLTVPTHVPWTGGVMGTVVDLSVKWTTGLEGMSSSTGENNVLWRAWESWEQNLARGVKPESMGKSWGGK